MTTTLTPRGDGDVLTSSATAALSDDLSFEERLAPPYGARWLDVDRHVTTAGQLAPIRANANAALRRRIVGDIAARPRRGCGHEQPTAKLSRRRRRSTSQGGSRTHSDTRRARSVPLRRPMPATAGLRRRHSGRSPS